MPIKTLLLSCFLFPVLLFSQEDSTVNLLPHFQKGDLLNYTISSSLISNKKGDKKTISEVYTLNLELLKSAYGLSVFKAGYSSEGGKLKSGLEVYFTIDSNKRFVAIENKRNLALSLNKKSLDTSQLFFDSTYFESYFPELDLIFFLNGATYRIGEVYTSETYVLNKGELITSEIRVEMMKFDRNSNRFEIKVIIQPKEENNSKMATDYHFIFNLNTLKLIELNSEQHYFFDEVSYQKNLMIKVKSD